MDQEIALESTKDASDGGDTDHNGDKIKRGDLLYGVLDRPAWYLVVSLGLQHFLTMFASVLSYPILLAGPMCLDNPVDLGNIVGTMFFVSGLITLLQTTFGSRLPIVQGPSYAYFVPTLVILRNYGSCPTFPDTPEGREQATEVWQIRMREIQGAIILASCVQILIGFTGLIGLLLRFIGPITVAAVITVIGLSLFPVALNRASVHWGISVLTIVLVTIFSRAMSGVSFKCRNGGTFPIFTYFPIILAMGISWITCYILTITNVFPSDPDAYGYGARTDLHRNVWNESQWFRIPYPGQWGTPTASIAGAIGMVAAVVASVIESVGDYHACADISGALPPPMHATNRGIGIEGVGGVISGLLGSGSGSTSFGQNIGAIGLTKVGSRIVVQSAGVVLVIFGIFGKANALLSTIPDPVIGGIISSTFALLAAIGIANLKYVDLDSTRNLFIVGLAMFTGLSVPSYLQSNPGAINTGVEEIDLILSILCQTSMLLSGLVACLLDNLLPGTLEERGFKWRESFGAQNMHKSQSQEDLRQCYDLPFGMKYIRKWKWTRFIPFCPTYKGINCNCRRYVHI